MTTGSSGKVSLAQMGFEILIVYRQISVNVEVNKTGEKATRRVKKEIVSLNVFQIYFF